MKKASRKWYLMYAVVRDYWGRKSPEIVLKEFNDELDLLVWASESAIPKGVGQHYMITPREVKAMPVELYARIEQLRKQRIEEERKIEEAEKREVARYRKIEEARAT